MSLVNQIPDELWFRISGGWDRAEIDGIAHVADTKKKPYKYNYSELINNHTIISSDELTFDRMIVKARLEAPKGNDSALAVFFNSPGDFRVFDAFIITGNETGITTASLIKSSILDSTLPRNKKSNFLIETLTSTPIDIPYGSDFTLEIRIEQKKISLLINGKNTLSQARTTKSEPGKFGFYHRNNIARLFEAKVYQKKKLVFSDDFIVNRIKKPTVKGTFEKQSQ